MASNATLAFHSVLGERSSHVPWPLSRQQLYSSPQTAELHYVVVDHTSHHVFCRLQPQPKHLTAWVATHSLILEGRKAELVQLADWQRML